MVSRYGLPEPHNALVMAQDMEGAGDDPHAAPLGQSQHSHVAAETAAVDVVTADEGQLTVQAVNIGV